MISLLHQLQHRVKHPNDRLRTRRIQSPAEPLLPVRGGEHQHPLVTTRSFDGEASASVGMEEGADVAAEFGAAIRGHEAGILIPPSAFPFSDLFLDQVPDQFRTFRFTDQFAEATPARQPDLDRHALDGFTGRSSARWLSSHAGNISA